MRPRALAFLFAVTTGDYVLWDWSVAGSHDVLALASGLTLLPLVAISAACLGIAVLQALGRVAHRAPRLVRRAPRLAHEGAGARLAAERDQTASSDATIAMPDVAPDSIPTSQRLAA